MTESTDTESAFAFEARLVADVRADATLPDRELTPDEREHLGITKESE